MRKLVVLGLLLPLCASVTRAAEHGSRNRFISMNDNAVSDDCRDHLRVGDEDFRSNLRDEETKTVPNQPLTISAERNGGIQVTTWDRPDVSLKLCKQVAANDDNEGRRVLAETHLVINGANISVQSPDKVSDDGDTDEGESHHSLGTVLLVKAPKNANLTLNVRNGGVSLNGFSGTAEAHAQNGGISFKRSTGKLTARAENGGISIKDCGGEISAKVENGGLSITLPEHWEGKGLDAQARNGGLEVAVPKNFNGGLEVVASEHTSIICKDSDVCNAGERTWDNGRKLFRMGGANPQVHAETENGGIVIKERSNSRGD
ncbi:MAG TPA: hypothetical protein VKH81_23550 [Candidatus Angelobacter sp.]|nr:hypothetical protein [Candidatus Angelobacter sp.]